MSNPADYPYATFLDVKFPPLAVVDVPSVVNAVTHRWYNQTLCKVNDSVIRLGVMQGEYHWHKHDADDEFSLSWMGISSSISKGDPLTCSLGMGMSSPRASSIAQTHPSAQPS